MYIFTKKDDNVIIEKCENLEEQSNGNYLLDPTGEPDMGRVAIPKSNDIEKIKLCSEIMRQYYGGVIGIHNFFNLEQVKIEHKKVEKEFEHVFD